MVRYVWFRRLCAAYGNRCMMCGRDGVRLTRDHIIPRSAGGENSLWNIGALCLECNLGKANSIIPDYRPQGWESVVEGILNAST